MSGRESSIFANRQRGREMMDDFSVVDRRLEEALQGLRWTNRWLGGYQASLREIRPVLRQRPKQLRIMDVGCGIADFTLPFIGAGERYGVAVSVTGVDANPRTVELARSFLRDALEPRVLVRAEVVHGDALDLPFEDDSFDIAHASLFLHHFEGGALRRVMSEMMRVSRLGIIINDLHRHPLSYAFVRLLALLPFFGEMFSHDGPVSVLRAFRRHELEDLAHELDLDARIRWHPGFRWVLSSLATSR